MAPFVVVRSPQCVVTAVPYLEYPTGGYQWLPSPWLHALVDAVCHLGPKVMTLRGDKNQELRKKQEKKRKLPGGRCYIDEDAHSISVHIWTAPYRKPQLTSG